MKFAYKALDSSGRIVTSVIEAADRASALALLHKKGFKVISIITKIGSDLKQTTHRKLQFSQKRKFKLSKEILLSFFEKLARLLAADFSLDEAISSIKERVTNDTERKLASNVLSGVSSGLSFSDSLKNFDNGIDSNVSSILTVGESTGSLAKVLPDVVKFLRSQLEIKKKLKSAIAYPSFLLSFALVIMVLFLFVLLPGFENLIVKELGGEMPPIAIYLKAGTNWLKYAIPIVVICIVAGMVILPIIRKTTSGRYQTDKIILHLWPFSVLIPLFTKTNMSNLMTVLLSNGINMSDALRSTQTSIGNSILSDQFKKATDDILEGESVCDSFEKYKVLDGTTCDFIAIGEKVGNLSNSFKDVYSFYDDELKAALKKITAAFVSGVMIFTFSFVGLLAVTMVQTIMGAATGGIGAAV